QAEHDRREALRADEESKRKASRDADAAKAFREYHNNPASRGGVGSIHDYCQARFGHCYSTDLKQALAELNDLSFMQRYYPERANAKAWAADVKPIYVARCKFCRGCYRTEEELAEHQRTTKPCPKCRSVCSSGGEVHRCSVYGGPVIEDRVPEVKYEEIGEE